MLLGELLPVDKTEGRSSLTEGSMPLKPVQEILPGSDPVSRENTTPTVLISTQPVPAAAPPAEIAQGFTESKTLPSDPQKPTCPQCGGAIPDHGPPPNLPRDLARLQGPNLTVHSSSSSSRRAKSRGSVDNLLQPAAMAGGPCFRLLLACLACECSMLVLGLLETCSSCVHALCSSCCQACTRCCSAIQEAPVEELNCHAHCHSVLFESCCEPTECLEFCLECCDICHRS